MVYLLCVGNRKEKQMHYVKLTNEYGRTRNDMQWGPGMKHSVKGPLELCGRGIHFYQADTQKQAILLAQFMSPIYCYETGKAFSCKPGKITQTDGTKSCALTLTTFEEVAKKRITLVQRVAFAILCARYMPESSEFISWSDQWLLGVNRDKDANRFHAYFSSGVSAIRSADFFREKDHIYTKQYSADAALYLVGQRANPTNFGALAEQAMKY